MSKDKDIEMERRTAQEMVGYIKGYEEALAKVKADISRERLMFLKEGHIEFAEGMERAELIVSRYGRRS